MMSNTVKDCMRIIEDAHTQLTILDYEPPMKCVLCEWVGVDYQLVKDEDFNIPVCPYCGCPTFNSIPPETLCEYCYEGVYSGVKLEQGVERRICDKCINRNTL